MTCHTAQHSKPKRRDLREKNTPISLSFTATISYILFMFTKLDQIANGRESITVILIVSFLENRARQSRMEIGSGTVDSRCMLDTLQDSIT